MAIEDRNAHGGSAYPNVGILHDFMGLMDHFHLFFSIAIFQKAADMGKAVKGNPVRIDLGCNFLEGQEISRLFRQFLYGVLSGTRDRLVG